MRSFKRLKVTRKTVFMTSKRTLRHAEMRDNLTRCGYTQLKGSNSNYRITSELPPREVPKG